MLKTDYPYKAYLLDIPDGSYEEYEKFISDMSAKRDMVGYSGHMGMVLAESVKWGEVPLVRHIVSLYDVPEETAFKVVLWNMPGNFAEKEHTTPDDQEAVETYLKWAFGIEL